MFELTSGLSGACAVAARIHMALAGLCKRSESSGDGQRQFLEFLRTGEDEWLKSQRLDNPRVLLHPLYPGSGRYLCISRPFYEAMKTDPEVLRSAAMYGAEGQLLYATEGDSLQSALQLYLDTVGQMWDFEYHRLGVRARNAIFGLPRCA